MNHRVWLAVAAIFALFPFSAALAASRIVYPTGIWPDDMNNVQAAVSSDGNVLLRAVNRAGRPTAFNFGAPADPGRRQVLLEANVDIEGETIRGSRTTIQGGLHPFAGISPFSRRISGIDFVGAQNAAIEILASAGRLEISGNRIFTVAPTLDAVGFTESQGIFISAEDTGAVTGQVRIWGNRIDLSGSTAQFRFGIQVSSADADVDIEGNEVFIAQSPVSGRLVDSEGISTVRCHSRVNVNYNSVHLGPYEAFDGIGAFGDADATYRIAGNIVVNEAPLAVGISLTGKATANTGFTGGVVQDNIVSMRDGLAAIALLGTVSNVMVRENFVVGEGAFGLVVSNELPTDIEANNRLLDNDLQHFTETDVGILLDTSSENTIVTGVCKDVLDLGVGNQLLCQKGH